MLKDCRKATIASLRSIVTSPTNHPRYFVKEVRAVEGDLHLSADERLPAETLFPYLGLLVRMKNTDSVVAKRDIYRQLVSVIEDPQQEYVVSEEEAEQLLSFLMATPPFPTHLNPTVGLLFTVVAAMLTTMWGSKFGRKTYGRGVRYLGRCVALGRLWPWYVCTGLGTDQQRQCAQAHRLCAGRCARLSRIAGERILTCCALVLQPSRVPPSPRHSYFLAMHTQQGHHW